MNDRLLPVAIAFPIDWPSLVSCERQTRCVEYSKYEAGAGQAVPSRPNQEPPCFGIEGIVRRARTRRHELPTRRRIRRNQFTASRCSRHYRPVKSPSMYSPRWRRTQSVSCKNFARAGRRLRAGRVAVSTPNSKSAEKSSTRHCVRIESICEN